MTKFTLLILFIAGFCNLTAQETFKTVSLKSEKTFKYNSHSEIIIQAERGLITIQKWEKPEVNVVFTRSAKNKEESVARKDLDRISYNLVSNRGNIFLNNKTAIRENEPGDIKSKIACSYVIHVPSWANITVNNKFGRVTVNEIEGVLKGNLQYCDLAITKYKGILDLTIQIGDFSATNLDVRGSIKTRYSGVSINNVSGKLSVTTESGNFKVISGEKPFNLTLNSHATDILIRNANCSAFDLQLEGSYCPVTITKECYSLPSKYVLHPGPDDKDWLLHYTPEGDVSKLKISAIFGSLTLL